MSKQEKPLNPPLFGSRKDWTSEERDADVTLRDLFAAFALAGYEASLGPDTPSDREVAAEYAYTRADAMLAERAKRGEG